VSPPSHVPRNFFRPGTNAAALARRRRSPRLGGPGQLPIDQDMPGTYMLRVPYTTMAPLSSPGRQHTASFSWLSLLLCFFPRLFSCSGLVVYQCPNSARPSGHWTSPVRPRLIFKADRRAGWFSVSLGNTWAWVVVSDSALAPTSPWPVSPRSRVFSACLDWFPP